MTTCASPKPVHFCSFLLEVHFLCVASYCAGSHGNARVVPWVVISLACALDKTLWFAVLPWFCWGKAFGCSMCGGPVVYNCEGQRSRWRLTGIVNKVHKLPFGELWYMMYHFANNDEPQPLITLRENSLLVSLFCCHMLQFSMLQVISYIFLHQK